MLRLIRAFSYCIIKVTILHEKHQDERLLLPRIQMIPTDTLFKLIRLQFPVRLFFSITISKTQVQSIQICVHSLILSVHDLENH